jgi:hypothetical protein
MNPIAMAVSLLPPLFRGAISYTSVGIAGLRWLKESW